MAGRPDIYLTSGRTGRFLHISVHQAEYGMHVKIKAPQGEQVHVVPHPKPLVEGVSRLVEIRIPPAAATYDTGRAQTVWVTAPERPDLWIAFEVIAEEPGAANREADWNQGTAFVGRIPAYGGRTVAVAAWPMHGEGGSWTLPATDAEKDRIRAPVASGGVRALLQGSNPDGSLWFLELAGDGTMPSPSSDIARR